MWWKHFVVGNILCSETFCVLKYFVVENILWWKTFFNGIIFWSKKIFMFGNILYRTGKILWSELFS